MIDRATIDKIMDATNIVDVVGEFVTLRKAGVNYKGLCPFHDDTTPSFMVSPSKQICHCFACGEGGNAVNFLMKHEQITYPEALRWLARKYNIEIEEKELTEEEKKEQSDRESMFVVNEWAMGYFQDILKNDPDGVAIGKQYFRSRGIRDDIIEKFCLGYSPQKRDALAQAAKKAGYQEEFLVKTGLCFEKSSKVVKELSTDANTLVAENASKSGNGLTTERSGSYLTTNLLDRYSGRVIFPWMNVSGKVVAFGGRLLDSRTKGVQQKYVNSPDSEIYHKERELYGLYQAKKAIAKEERVYMVEGYTDVIAMHQCGIENVVANSGTALSNYQIRLLRRFTENITLLYDGDEAGIHAAMRGTDMLLAEGMKVKVLLLPDGDDPDSFARKHTASEFKDYIEKHATDFIRFKTRLTVDGVSDPVKRSDAISGIVRSISMVPGQILRLTYIAELAQQLGMKEQTLIDTMNGMIRGDIEEKERERQRSGKEVGEVKEIKKSPDKRSDNFLTSLSSDEEVERLLIQTVIRNGEKVIYDQVATEDGGTTSLTVAQYIAYDLGQDGLMFHDARYNQILDEAVAHSGEPDFVAESYFMQHHDVGISQLATQLGIDRHQLGKGFQVKERDGALLQHVLHLVLDFRYVVLGKRVKELLNELKTKTENYKETINEYLRVKDMYDKVSKKLGRDVR